MLCECCEIKKLISSDHRPLHSSMYMSIYTIILLMDTVTHLTHLTSVALICGLYRPSSEPIASPNVLKCPTRHTLQTIRFWHFSSAALIVKKLKNAVLRHRSVNEF